MKRLNSSEALAQYTSQFVTIKMATNTKEWQEFHREFKGDHSGSVRVPFVYIIRSDGTTMFSGTGMMEVPEMGEVLHRTLGQSGRYFSERELSLLEDTKKKIAELQEAKDIKGAIALLRKVSKLGPLGEIPSYARPAMEMNELVAQMVNNGNDTLTSVVEKMESITSGIGEAIPEDEKLQFLDQYLKASDDYSGLKPLKPYFAKMRKLLKKDDGLSTLLRDYRAVLKSKSAKSISAIKKAVTRMELIVRNRDSGALVDKANAVIGELQERLEAK